MQNPGWFANRGFSCFLIVQLEKVCKAFSEGEGHRDVLLDLDFQVDKGEVVALLGASGSGKSTLLNIVAGLALPDSGKVKVADVELHKLDEEARTLFRRRSIGFVFQFFHLVPTLTVEENLRLPLQLNGLENAETPAVVEELLGRVGLADRAGVLPDRLSGGEQQRIAVARALIHSPPIVLADEPTGNLDQEAADSVLDLVFGLSKEKGASVLVVTHSEEVAGRCDRSQRIVSGKLAEAAP